MTNIRNLKALAAKLNETCRSALHGAMGMCAERTNYNVEIEHWLLKLLEAPGCDIHDIFRFYEIDVSRVMRDLMQTIDAFKSGNSRTPSMSVQTVEVMEKAYLHGSVEYGAARVRSGHLLYALLADDALARLAREMSDEFSRIAPDDLLRDMPDLVAKSIESRTEYHTGEPAAEDVAAMDGSADHATGGSLEQFTIDLTAVARNGKLDPVVGRESEVRQIVDILTRRRQNNPILTGEAGVGKTAVVEGFAQRVANGDVPPTLKDVVVRTLDLGLLQAGASMRGEFENRLKSVISEVKASPKPVVLFIDEAHTLVGAGGQAGQGDAANLLKPALARGELRTIAATTWSEYKKYFEKDAALARRFQVVKVEEPTEEIGSNMMRGHVAMLEAHHGVRILDEAVHESVRLSNRYISGRQLPDKAVSLLDTACARVGIGHSATPPAIEDAQRRIEHFETSIRILTREEAAGVDHSERLAELHEHRDKTVEELEAFQAQWQEERELIGQLCELRTQLESALEEKTAATSPPEELAATMDAETQTVVAEPATSSDGHVDRQTLTRSLRECEDRLRKAQGERPLMHPCVDRQAVAEVVSGWTGIPVGRMVSDEIQTVLSLRERLQERIIGQEHALEAIAQRIRTSRANLTDPRRPIGVFLMVGTSGVGKTETALALANLLYGGEQNMTTINMSEFKEEHKVSLLMGSPPGYVGYGEGGVLTEAVRRKPYSVVLLDEMEKAHPGVQDIFYQVFDKGTMKDGEGRDIDFKNTVIIMTSNAGTDLITSMCADAETRPKPEKLAEALHPELMKTFKPAFLGRVTIIPYFPLTDDVMRQIVELQLGRVARRIHEHYRATFSYAPELVEQIAERCREVQTGARNVDHILTGTLLPELSAEFLARMAEGKAIQSAHVTLDAQGSLCYEIN
ncbi:MAG: type VI secretion system ATPase TssH [Phycisphaerales bacterium]|nr:MAG: type VI secretion system ATPase TssH [Phycisphaerales bacterium]